MHVWHGARVRCLGGGHDDVVLSISSDKAIDALRSGKT